MSAESTQKDAADSSSDAREQLRIEQQRSWQAGERVQAEHLLALAHLDAASTVDIIYGEFLLRQQFGETPQPSEYVRRFPQYERLLQRQFEIHQWMESPDFSGTKNASQIDSANSSSPEPTATSIGAESEIGDFRLIREIGSGGMGVVYEAEQNSLQRRVALKILSTTSVADRRHLERFKSESLIAAQLSHPHIVRILAVGHEESVYYYAMELIHGSTLQQVIEDGCCSAKQPTRQGDKSKDMTVRLARHDDSDVTRFRDRLRYAAKVCCQVAEALEHAHQFGVLHRDVKPSNIMIDEAGDAYLADFGLARLEGASETASGDVVGTLKYMSPEQLLGRRAEVGERSDIYALGATLYELVTLRPLFTLRNDTASLFDLTMGRAVTPCEIDRRVPRDLETIILKATAPSCADRYESATAMAEDLRRFLSDRPILARRLSISERFVKWAHRNNGLVAATACFLMLLAITLAGSAALLWRSRALAVVALNQTQQLLYASDMDQAFDAWEKRWTDEVTAILARHVPSRGATDHRGLEWRLLNSVSESFEPIVLHGHEGAVNEVAVFPDGKRAATVGDDGVVCVWDLEDGKPLQSFRADSESLYAVAISPSNAVLATGRYQLSLWDIASGTKIRDLTLHDASIESIAFSSDGQLVASGSRYDEIRIISLEHGLVGTIRDNARHESLEFAGDNQHLLSPLRTGEFEYAGIIRVDRDKIRAFEETDQDELRRRRGDQAEKALSEDVCQVTEYLRQFGSVTCAAYSERHRDVIAGSKYQHRAAYLELKGSRVRWVLPSDRDQLNAVASSRFGRLIATAHNDGVVTYWSMQGPFLAPELAPSFSFQAHEGSVTSLKFGRDQRMITTGIDGTAKVWNLGAAGQVAMIPPDQWKDTSDLVFQRDGRGVIAVNRNGHLWINGKKYPPDGDHATLGKYYVDFGSSVGRVATSSSESGDITIWDSETGAVLSELRHGGPNVNGIGFSPDGRWLASTGDNATVIIWAMPEGREVTRFRLPHHGWTLAFSPDGSELACGGRFPEVLIWDVTGRRISRRLTTESSTRQIAFSPNGTMLAGAHDDSVIRIWDIRSTQRLAELSGHDQSVNMVTFSPDGKTISSAGHDGTVRLWSVPLGRQFGVFNRRDGLAEAVAISPDGNRMAAGFSEVHDGGPSLVIWDVAAETR